MDKVNTVNKEKVDSKEIASVQLPEIKPDRQAAGCHRFLW
jgi:hypothetical protein